MLPVPRGSSQRQPPNPNVSSGEYSSESTDKYIKDPFHIHSVLVELGERSSSSSSALQSNFIDKVYFEELHGFKESDCMETLRRVQSLPPDALNDANAHIKSATVQVKPSKLPGSVAVLEPGAITSNLGSTGDEISSDVECTRTCPPVFPDEASMMGVYGNIFSAVNSLVQILTGTNRLSIRTRYIPLGRYLGTHVGSQNRNARHQEIAMVGNPAPGAPASSSGLTGGAGSQRTVSTPPAGMTNTGDVRVGKQLSALPDFSLLELRRTTDTNGKAICCFELKGPEKCVTGKQREPDYRPLLPRPNSKLLELPSLEQTDSTEGLVRRLNLLLTSGGSDKVYMSAQRPIAQAISYALSSSSGFSYLLNFNYGIVMKVDKGEREEKFRVKVALIRSHPSDPISQTTAMTTASLLAVERLVKENKTMEEELTEICKLVGPPDPKKSNNSRDGSSSSGMKRTSQSMSQSHPSKKQNLNSSETRRACVQKGTAGNSEFSSSSQEGSDRTIAGLGKKLSVQLNDESEIEDIMANAQELIGYGGSGNVYRGWERGACIALKVWKGASGNGLGEMCNEIAVYLYLQEKHSKVLGRFVPRLVAYWTKLHDLSIVSKVGLVVEFVGSRIYEDVSRLVVEGNNCKELQKEDVMGIRNAAISSLEGLHSTNVAHGDVELRNLRVKNIGYGESSTVWTAWWIDLGQSFIVSKERSNLLEWEVNACRSIFYGYLSDPAEWA